MIEKVDVTTIRKQNLKGSVAGLHSSQQVNSHLHVFDFFLAFYTYSENLKYK